MDNIEERLKNLPDDPGVYVMLDANNNIIYVGKAKNLKRRVKQYFYSNVKTDKVMAMVKNINNFYYIITKTEIDALSLESNLIKKHKPKYNIMLKDDKNYPYIKIDLKDDFPSLKITRMIKKDGAKYFGPFMAGISVRDIIDIISMAYGLRSCSVKISNDKIKKECLNYHIKKCLSPCSHRVSKEEYRKHVNLAIDFLSGNDDAVETILKEKMERASENEEFEEAISLRDKLYSLDKIKLKRLTSLNRFLSADVIASSFIGKLGVISLLIIRNGKMLGAKNFSLGEVLEDENEAISTFIEQYYIEGVEVPEEIIIEKEIETELLEEYLKAKFEKKVNIINTKQGVRKQLVDMASSNALDYLQKYTDKIQMREKLTFGGIEELKDLLNLNKVPKRMECFDISNISGVDKVGSMVVFLNGEAEKTEYRRFKIQTVQGSDDFRSLQEVLRRRLEKLKNNDIKFAKPDLIVIDGGKGQLSSVKKVFDEYNINDIELISLAEREEEVFTLFSSDSIILSKRSYALKLLQRIRDEAHRFAITYFRKIHTKRNLESELLKIEGVGESRRKMLLEKFKTVDNLKVASVLDIESVKNIGKKQAEIIYNYFRKEEE